MKRIWIGVIVLLGLLAVGLFLMWLTDQRLSQVSSQLEKAAQAESWDRAVELSEQAKGLWTDNWYFCAALADHTDIDQIDAIFAQLDVYVKRKDPVAHAATCAYLAEAITDLEENHRLTWWNLL
jgi:hypothetical protein